MPDSPLEEHIRRALAPLDENIVPPPASQMRARAMVAERSTPGRSAGKSLFPPRVRFRLYYAVIAGLALCVAFLAVSDRDEPAQSVAPASHYVYNPYAAESSTAPACIQTYGLKK